MLSMTGWPLMVTLMPSSDSVMNRYVSENRGLILPVHRAEKYVALGMLAGGA